MGTPSTRMDDDWAVFDAIKADADRRTNRRLANVTLIAWALVSALLFLRVCRVRGIEHLEIGFSIVVCVVSGSILSLVYVSIPFRVLQNVVQPERRTAQIAETVWCVIAFCSFSYASHLAITTYPKDW